MVVVALLVSRVCGGNTLLSRKSTQLFPLVIRGAVLFVERKALDHAQVFDASGVRMGSNLQKQKNDNLQKQKNDNLHECIQLNIDNTDLKKLTPFDKDIKLVSKPNDFGKCVALFYLHLFV